MSKPLDGPEKVYNVIHENLSTGIRERIYQTTDEIGNLERVTFSGISSSGDILFTILTEKLVDTASGLIPTSYTDQVSFHTGS